MAYLTPRTMTEAFATLGQPGVAVIAGGTDWFPQAGDRLTDSTLLDVTRLPGFRGISQAPNGWRIGAATRWSDVIAADLPAVFDALKAAAREVGSVQIQNSGTLAGNLCNASPAADGVPPLLVLQAEVELMSREGSRVLPLADFITGVRKTALRPGELVSAILVPRQPAAARGGFSKLGSRRYLVISIAMAAAVIQVEDGRITEAAIAVGACSAVAQRLRVLEQRLIGQTVAQALAPVTAAELAGLTPISDLRGTADYRAEAVAEMVHRLIARLVAAEGRQP